MGIATPVTNSGEFTAAGTSAVPYPATIHAKACLLLYGSVANAALVTLPSGFTSVFSFSATSSSASPDLFCAYKTGGATGSESGTLTVTHNNNVNIFGMAAIDGVDPDNPVALVGAAYDPGSGNTNSVPTVTVTDPGSMLFLFNAMASTLAAWGTPSGPGTFTEVMDLSTGTRSAQASYLNNVQAGATGTITTVASGSSLRIGRVIVLRPANRGQFLRFL